MNMIRTLMLSTVVAGLAASPLLALDLTINQSSALSIDRTTMLVDKSSTAKASTDASMAEEMVTPMEDSKFVGNQVFTKDQVLIGSVEKVGMMDTGMQKIWIVLNSDIGSTATFKAFTVRVPKDTTADGALTLGFTQAELFKELGLESIAK